MEDIKFLYPVEDVDPVGVGDGYRDYWLSDVLKSNGGFVKFVKIGCHWRDGWARCFVKLGRFTGEGVSLLWVGEIVTPKGFVVHPDARHFIEDDGAHSWSDLKVRYYLDDDGRLCFPRCVAARHVRDYENANKHVDACVDFSTGEHYWNISDI